MPAALQAGCILLVHMHQTRTHVAMARAFQLTWNSLSMASFGSSLMRGLLVMFLALQHSQEHTKHNEA
jgi:hypothetical protein